MVLKIERFGKYVKKDIEIFEIWRWRRTEKISSALRLKNEGLY